MGAINDIVFEGTCPGCGYPGELKAQAHIGANFCGDHTGRFCHRTYRLGEKMAWYDPSSPSYSEWRAMDFTGSVFRWANDETDEAIECCALLCPHCVSTGDDLAAILRFKELRCVEVVKLCYDEEITWSDLGPIGPTSILRVPNSL